MGLRCSLLGHDYGEPFVERGREERGNEVVVTERELQECSRCGAENVTTENTEVRSIEPSGSSTAAPDAGASDDSTASKGAVGDSSADASGDEAGGATSGGAFTSPSDAIERAEADAQAGDGSSTADNAPAGGADAATDASEDDAVIIDDSVDDAAGSEQWDEQADVDPDAEREPTPEPDDEGAEFVDGSPTGDGDSAPSSGVEGEPTDDDSASSDTAATGQSGGAQAVAAERTGDRPRGEWPDHDGEDAGVDATDDSTSFQFGDEDEQFVEADTGFTSAGPIEQSESEDDLDFALYCPECGFERHAAGSSLRAGDICPDCRKGYLAEDR